jgi:hypothetical protein
MAEASAKEGGFSAFSLLPLALQKTPFRNHLGKNCDFSSNKVPPPVSYKVSRVTLAVANRLRQAARRQ